MLVQLLSVALLATTIPVPTRTISTVFRASEELNADLVGRFSDSLSGKPLAGVDLTVRRGDVIIARVSSDQFGSYRVHDLAPGTYAIQARMIGFAPQTRTVTMPANTNLTLDFAMMPVILQLAEIGVTATPLALDTRTGDQTFKQSDYQGAPTQTTSQILQQSIAGAARAPTGEVHPRGQHAEFTYYIDGLPVPPGISGSLNEIFDPTVVNQIDFQTGGWDAEFGKRNAIIVKVETKVPTGKFHMSVMGYSGNFASNGQTVTMSGNAGKFGFFVAGTRQATDLRREPVVADTTASGQITGLRNYANDGQDLFAFGKVQYVVNNHDLINLDINLSRTRFGIPFDSAAGVINDRQQDLNHFVNLSWQHRDIAGAHAGSEAFAGVYVRRGALDYSPGLQDAPSFTFAPDTTLYNIREARSFNVYGLKADYLYQVAPHLNFKVGTDVSLTRGSEAFSTLDAAGRPGPGSNAPLKGSDEAGYVQSVYQPMPKVELRVGVRYDRHEYPLSETEGATVSQVSPRFRLNLYPDMATTLSLYYGRLFIPTNTEDLRSITTAAAGQDVQAPTLPERDHFFEVGILRRFSGIVAKLSWYQKRSAPGLDDTQIPGSAISTDVNIGKVSITGIEGVLEIRPPGPLSGFANIALNHAYGSGAVTGAFLAQTPPAQPFDLDHDQRVSSVVGLTYSTARLLLSATGNYGSGLTNGVTPNFPGAPGYDPSIPATPQLRTGLFDFNKAFKVAPSFIFSASAGYTINTRGVNLRPQFFVDNIFNLKYLLKGAFFSGTTFGRPRTFSVRLTVGM